MERSEEATQQARELAAEAEQLQARVVSTQRSLVRQPCRKRQFAEDCVLVC